MSVDFAKYRSAIDRYQKELEALSDEIWGYAETAFSEKKSADAMTAFLAKAGFKVTYPAYKIDTAYYAEFGSGEPRIGILGEFDALSNLNQVAGKTEKEAFCPGANGHGCGHNMLGVGSIAAALMAKAYLEDGHSGTVVYYGCPGEEGGSGKAFMAREGAFKDLAAAITWHPGQSNIITTDSSLANVQVLFRFKGISAHAAGCPEMGRSALDALELMNVGTNFLREHMISQARIHYSIIDGGGISPNVVQNYAAALYLIRAPKVGQVQELYERVKKIAYGASCMTETEYELDFVKSCANEVPNTTLEKALYQAFQEEPAPVYTEEEYALARTYTETVPGHSNKQIGDAINNSMIPANKAFLKSVRDHRINDFIVPYEEVHLVKSMGGSTDVGDVSWMCPTAQFNTATWAPDTPGHSWQVVSQGKSSQAHKGMLYAARVMGHTAIDLFEKPEVLAAAKAEWQEALEGETYVPIPDGVVPRSISELK